MKAEDANTVIAEHHQLLRTLTDQIDDTNAGTAQHRGLIDRLLLELDIHMQIEDTLYYPAVSRVSPLVAVAHAEHRAVSDQLAAALRTKVDSNDFPIEWDAFTTTLHHHAAEEERDMFPHARHLGDTELVALGAAMTSLLNQRRRSLRTRLRVRIKTTLLRHL
jgi:hypothetical protein